MKKIGITTTVPIEVLAAAGFQPVDLNNILVTDPYPGRYIHLAERAGFPLNCCAWIKGIYGVCMDSGIEDVMCVTGGDCSNTLMLMEVLRLKGLNTIPFAYPDLPEPPLVQGALEALAASLGTTVEAAEKAGGEIRKARGLALALDEMTWRDNNVSGRENHLWLVSSSDFNGDVAAYSKDVQALIDECRGRRPYSSDELRLGFIGVPPVFAAEFYPFLEKHGARAVFNEVQRQFAMPGPGSSLAELYAAYTYPYSINGRLADIQNEIRRRRIDGIIHYVQAFCHRGIGDIIFREKLGLPMLTLEGNDDFFLNNHVRTRIEAFLDMLLRSRQAAGHGNRAARLK
jgi:benzoyl-CoA reductase/2-hydroxyglutaryl-CoA dehydratase subunit BcrC/BadD/HgdB